MIHYQPPRVFVYVDRNDIATIGRVKEILKVMDSFLDSMDAEIDRKYIYMRYKSHFLLICIQFNTFHFLFSANFNPGSGVRIKFNNEERKKKRVRKEFARKSTQTDQEKGIKSSETKDESSQYDAIDKVDKETVTEEQTVATECKNKKCNRERSASGK